MLRRFRRHYILGTLAAFYVVGFVWPYVQPRPDQDNCVFGPVDNAEYRRILAKAREGVFWDWLVGVRGDREFSKMIERRFSDMTLRESDGYRKLATIYAILRAYGGVMVHRGGEPPFLIREGSRGRYINALLITFLEPPPQRAPFFLLSFLARTPSRRRGLLWIKMNFCSPKR